MRVPAEFEPTETVWLTRPHNGDTWPDSPNRPEKPDLPANRDFKCLEAAQQEFDQFAELLSKVVRVRVTQDEGIQTSDSWVRDYGPIFARDENELIIHQFRFNGWGDKYEGSGLDDRAGDRIGELAALETGGRQIKHNLILEGGSVDFNGQGSMLTTKQCLLSMTRGTRDLTQLNDMFHEAFGINETIWLDGKLAGDDTDGHIDTMARWVGPKTIAAILPEDESHDDYRAMLSNWRKLESHEAGFELVRLPEGPSCQYDFPDSPEYDIARDRLPCGYANFLLCNQHLFLPTYDHPNDEVAAERLQTAMPDWTIVPVMSKRLIVGLGSLHCLSMQQPVVK